MGTFVLFAGILIFAGVLLFAPKNCHGQGTLHIAFDSPPQLPAAGQSFFVQQYFESGMWFRPMGVVGPGNGFSRRRGGGQLVGAPDNGTAFLAAPLGSTLIFSFSEGQLFDMFSVDLAEYSTVVPVLAVTFVGYRFDGSIITTSLTPDGIIDGTGPLTDFETFYFDTKDWSGLDRVEIPTYGWSLDNLVVVTIPEPASGTLLLGGIFALYVAAHRRRKLAPRARLR